MTAAPDPPGHPPSPEMLRWQQAATALGPEQTALRLAANAKYVVVTVTVVGTVLTALGLVSTDRIADRPIPHVLAVTSIIMTISAVLLALRTLVLRSRDVNLDNLQDVKAWYHEELSRGLWVTAAGWLLLGGILFAGAAGVVSAVEADPSYQVGLQSAGLGDKATISVKAAVSDVGRGSIITVRVTGKGGAGSNTVLVQSSRTTDTHGAATIDASFVVGCHFQSYTVILTSGGQQRAVMTIPAT